MVRGESGPRRRGEVSLCGEVESDEDREVSLGPGPLGQARLEKLEEWIGS